MRPLGRPAPVPMLIKDRARGDASPAAGERGRKYEPRHLAALQRASIKSIPCQRRRPNHPSIDRIGETRLVRPRWAAPARVVRRPRTTKPCVWWFSPARARCFRRRRSEPDGRRRYAAQGGGDRQPARRDVVDLNLMLAGRGIGKPTIARSTATPWPAGWAGGRLRSGDCRR